MDHEELMTYAVGMMIPIPMRKYFLQEEWEQAIIPKNEGNRFISYSHSLDQIIKDEDPSLLRSFIRENTHWYQQETEELLALKDEHLKTIAKLIKMEKEEVKASRQN